MLHATAVHCPWAVTLDGRGEAGVPAAQAEQVEADLDAELEALEVELASTLCEDTHVRCMHGPMRGARCMPAMCMAGSRQAMGCKQGQYGLG